MFQVDSIHVARLGRCIVAAMVTACVSGCGRDKEGSGLGVLDSRHVALISHSRQAFQMGEYSKALVYADSVLHEAPGLPEIHFRRGIILMELRRYDDAREAFERTVELSPKFPEARFGLGNVALKQGRFKDALKEYDQELKNIRAIRESTKRQRRFNESHAVSMTFTQIARVHQETNNPAEARVAYERALDVNPHNVEALTELALLVGEEGEPEAGLAYALRALEISPNGLYQRYIAGNLLIESGRWEEALFILKQVLASNPRHPDANYSTGRVLTLLGRRQEAQQYLARADSIAAISRQLMYAEAAVDRYPSSASHWIVYARLLRQSERLPEAGKAIEIALSLDQDNLVIQEEWADVQFMMGRYLDAGARYRSILRQDSTLAEVWFKLGAAYERGKDTSNARQAWQNALVGRPDHQLARQHIETLRDHR